MKALVTYQHGFHTSFSACSSAPHRHAAVIAEPRWEEIQLGIGIAVRPQGGECIDTSRVSLERDDPVGTESSLLEEWCASAGIERTQYFDIFTGYKSNRCGLAAGHRAAESAVAVDLMGTWD